MAVVRLMVEGIYLPSGIPPVVVQFSKKIPKWVFFYFFVHIPISLYIKCLLNYTNIPECIKTISNCFLK